MLQEVATAKPCTNHRLPSNSGTNPHGIRSAVEIGHRYLAASLQPFNLGFELRNTVSEDLIDIDGLPPSPPILRYGDPLQVRDSVVISYRIDVVNLSKPIRVRNECLCHQPMHPSPLADRSLAKDHHPVSERVECGRPQCWYRLSDGAPYPGTDTTLIRHIVSAFPPHYRQPSFHTYSIAHLSTLYPPPPRGYRGCDPWPLSPTYSWLPKKCSTIRIQEHVLLGVPGRSRLVRCSARLSCLRAHS